MQSNAEAEPKALCYKNSHKCYSVLFLNQLTYVNQDPDWALGKLTKNLHKGGDSADKCGGCCQAGGEEESEGGMRRWGGRKTLHGHKYLSPPIPGIACIAATAMRRWRRGSATVGEGAAPVLALETWGWNTASLSGAKSMEGHCRVTLTSRAQRSNVSHLSWPRVQVF